MTNYLIDSPLDFESFPTEAIALTPECIDRAIQLSRQIQPEGRQWQTYLNALALFAFEQWLSDRAPDLSLELDPCSIFHPTQRHFIDAVCNLKVGDFKVCLIAVGSLWGEDLNLPRLVLDLPELAAQLYVIVEVLEETEEATIQGFVPRDRLLEHCTAAHLQPEADWTYAIPLTWFENDPDELLLYFRCLESQAIALPEIPVRHPAPQVDLQAQLQPLLPLLKSGQREVWEILTWEQVTQIFAHPELQHWLDRELSQSAKPDWSQAILNVGMWLRDEMDEFARELSWVLLPAFTSERLRLTTSSPMRSPVEELEAIVTQLERTGTTIPSTARGAYQTLKLASIPLRLYVVTWPLLSVENIPEWKLLLILGGSPSGTRLPNGTKMQISDNMSILLEQELNPHVTEPYLYSLVAGTWDEQFSVTLAFSSGEKLTLPPFVFRPN